MSGEATGCRADSATRVVLIICCVFPTTLCEGHQQRLVFLPDSGWDCDGPTSLRWNPRADGTSCFYCVEAIALPALRSG